MSGGNFHLDVLRKSKLWLSAAKCADLEMLEPVTRAHAQEILKLLGPGWMMYETFRSPARQRELFERKATDLRDVGVHAYGLAFDIVRNEADPGKKPMPSWHGDFSPLIQCAIERGLVAGLKRKNGTIDAAHVQRIRVADQKRLFAGTWYPCDFYEATEI